MDADDTLTRAFRRALAAQTARLASCLTNKWALAQQLQTLRSAVTELLAWDVDLDDNRLRYLIVRIDRQSLADVHAALAASSGAVEREIAPESPAIEDQTWSAVMGEFETMVPYDPEIQEPDVEEDESEKRP